MPGGNSSPVDLNQSGLISEWSRISGLVCGSQQFDGDMLPASQYAVGTWFVSRYFGRCVRRGRIRFGYIPIRTSKRILFLIRSIPTDIA